MFSRTYMVVDNSWTKSFGKMGDAFIQQWVGTEIAEYIYIIAVNVTYLKNFY